MANPGFITNSNYVSPVQMNAPIVISSIWDTFKNKGNTGAMIAEKSSTGKITVEDPDGVSHIIAEDIFTGGTYTPTVSGLYNIKYEFTYWIIVPGADEIGPYIQKVNFPITVIPNYDPLPNWTISSVLDRVLDLAEPHLMSEQPRFKLDAAQHAEFENIKAPEFAFTQKTLKEILDEIGGFIHGVPRLVKGESGKFDTIRYDMLGGTEPAPLSAARFEKEYVTKILTHNIENYATELDSSVDNLVNTLDDGEGGVQEPYSNGYKTVRSEEQYARITESNMVIATTLPIYKIQSLEYIDKTGKKIDITPYVFEGSDYGRLSSFLGNYPTSKAFAIYYERGQRNVRGLSFKSPNVIDGSLSNYAITNIIKAAGGSDISPEWWGDTGDKGNYGKIAFNITYTPIFASRVLQHKPYYTPGEFRRTLSYGQGASLVETRYYGENLKGVIARMGNAEVVKTFKLANKPSGLKLIPYIGQTWDGDYYVSGVACALYADHVDCMVSLSKDFNRLSQYIGINSQWRAYEVSELKAYDRDTVYSDYVVVGDPIVGDGKYQFDKNYIINTFAQLTNYRYHHMTAATVRTYEENGTKMREVTVPVISTAFGNTLAFDFYMADNYSAGAKSEQNGDEGYWQTDTPYCDYYGRVETLTFSLFNDGEPTAFDDLISFDLPQGAYDVNPGIWLTEADRLVVKKNGGETLRLHYCMKYVSNDRKIILGDALTRNCPLVRNANSRRVAELYVSTKPIGKFDKVFIPTADTALLHRRYTGGTGISNIIGGIKLDDFTSQINGAAWAIIDPTTKEILLAKNVPIQQGETVAMPQLTFTHKLP